MKLISFAIFGIILAFSIYGTYTRAEQWKSEESLFLSAVQSCPNSAKMHQQLGQVYESRGDLSMTFHHLSIARDLDPEWCDLDFCFAKYYIAKQDYGKAVFLLKENLRCIYTNMKSFPILMEIYKLYFQFNQKNITAHFEYAQIMEIIENIDMAAVHYRESGVIALNHGLYDDAQKGFDAALAVQPLQCDIYYWLGKLYVANKDLNKAAEIFQQGINCKGIEEDKVVAACSAELYTLLTQNGSIFTPEKYNQIVEMLKQVVKKLEL